MTLCAGLCGALGPQGGDNTTCQTALGRRTAPLGMSIRCSWLVVTYVRSKQEGRWSVGREAPAATGNVP